MNLIRVAAAIALVGLSGLVQAAPAAPPDESAFTLDLTDATGLTFFVRCENGRDISHCEQPSIWQQTNGLSGLQSTPLPMGGERFGPDYELIG